MKKIILSFFSQFQQYLFIGYFFGFCFFIGLRKLTFQYYINIPKYCDFNRSLCPKSSKKDVIFFYTSLYNNGLEISLKSLRTTGSQCRIILFVSDTFVLDRRAYNLLEDLDVEVITNCIDYFGRISSPHMLRFEYEKQWIENHIHEVNRIFHCDSLDVFFQSDPFSELIPSDEIFLVVEPQKIKHCVWNTNWIVSCFNDTIQRFLFNQYIICSGTIGGNALEYLKLINVMMNTSEWKKCWAPSFDQPILNYVVWRGLLKSNSIKYRFIGCESGLFTSTWCANDGLDVAIKYKPDSVAVNVIDPCL